MVVAGALLAAIAAIAVITTLQGRANASRDASLTVSRMAREFEALQSMPYDASGGGPAVRAAVRARMAASQREIAGHLSDLERGVASRHLHDVETPYASNMAVLQRIRSLVERGRDDDAGVLSPIAGHSHARAVAAMRRAGLEYRLLAASSQRLATLGSALTILVLVALFGVFYARSRRAQGRVASLARDNARLLVEDSQMLVLQRLALAAEYRDDDTGEHTSRVARLSRRLGEVLGMPEKELALLERAAPLHDVGKIGIPDRILLKPGPLTAEELEHMRTHTRVGAAMLSRPGFPLLEMAEAIALTHHERWDGTGYPGGLVGEEIPLAGRIVAVADVFDALTHARPYKPAWPIADAIAEIRGQAGHQFDPRVVEGFLAIVDELAPPERERRTVRAVPA